MIILIFSWGRGGYFEDRVGVKEKKKRERREKLKEKRRAIQTNAISGQK